MVVLAVVMFNFITVGGIVVAVVVVMFNNFISVTPGDFLMIGIDTDIGDANVVLLVLSSDSEIYSSPPPSSSLELESE